ncbi:MAG: DUF4491 family protein [Paludibacter sp.]|jgi:hypothetical protein|nr:DUF4491 family protein [Paludibacter sp.]
MTAFTELLNNYNITGLAIGFGTFVIIGLFHPIVIKSEYFFGVKIWWLFLIAGVAGSVLALIIKDVLFSSLLGVFAFSSFWGILELFEQRQRVAKGWFPKNQKRK